MQQFDALFIFLCPLEAETTHLQTHIRRDTKGVPGLSDEDFNRS